MKMKKLVQALLMMLTLGTALELATPSVAEARAGRGRSFGRSSGMRPSAPPPSREPSHSYNNSQTMPPQQQGMNPNRGGGFMRGLAGGLAGGFLGSMLFSSLGHASGFGGTGGGIGLFDILLLAGLGYFGLRWWKSRQQRPATAMARNDMSEGYESRFSPSHTQQGSSSFRALAPVAIDTETASDIFFRVQGAWTRRDLAPIKNLLGTDVQTSLGRDLDELKRNQEINRLENITVRRTDVLESWEEDGADYSTVRFTANLLDYTVKENGGDVVEGSDSVPVKFEEDWIFAKDAGSPQWQLVGIRQV